MSSIHAFIDRLVTYLLAASLAVVVGICFIQVIARYIFSASFSWVEEVSITILLWAMWGGACIALRDNTHLKVLILPEKLRPKTQVALRLGLNCLVIFFLGTIAYTSRLTIAAMENITLLSIDVSANVMYWSVPIGCFLMIYYAVRSIVQDWKRL
jgi:C4-dicarboxylate transporter DctQ subunit